MIEESVTRLAHKREGKKVKTSQEIEEESIRNYRKERERKLRKKHRKARRENKVTSGGGKFEPVLARTVNKEKVSQKKLEEKIELREEKIES